MKKEHDETTKKGIPKQKMKCMKCIGNKLNSNSLTSRQ